MKIHQGAITHEICCLAAQYVLVVVGLSGNLKGKQKLGVNEVLLIEIESYT